KRSAFRPEGHARVLVGSKPAAPQLRRNRLLIGMRNQSGAEDQKGRKVLVHTAQAIGQPCPQGRFAGNYIAGVHQKSRRLMVDRVGLHGVDKREVIHHLSGPGKEIAHPAPRLTLLRESPVGRGNRKTSLPAVMPVSAWLPRTESGKSLS